MFDDRSKSNYSFSKMDKQARTIVSMEEMVKNQNPNVSVAHKRLFGQEEKVNKEEKKELIKQDILRHKNEDYNIENLPSSNYLKQFNGLSTEDIDLPNLTPNIQNEKISKPQEFVKNEINFEKLIETASSIKVDNNVINKELNQVVSKPKKNYSFRIKLAVGVYCILVALFGGWIISNTINITNTNSQLQQTISKTSEINANITDIISDIKQLDNASGDPENETIVVKIVTEEIAITPEAITQPNAYETTSNWFDVFCNWLAGFFGG